MDCFYFDIADATEVKQQMVLSDEEDMGENDDDNSPSPQIYPKRPRELVLLILHSTISIILYSVLLLTAVAIHYGAVLVSEYLGTAGVSGVLSGLEYTTLVMGMVLMILREFQAFRAVFSSSSCSSVQKTRKNHE